MNIMNLYVYENRSMSNDLSKPLMLENLSVDNVQIHIPKEIDGTDMGTWAWWFVYQNAKREKYSIPMTLEGTTSDDGEEEYISTVGLNHGFTGKHGTVMYAIEAIQADGSGAVTHEWHTKTYKLEVVYTLQGNQTEYDESESDIISALISRVNELIQSGAEIAEIAETIENVAETAQEVIDSIPADYSELSAQVDTNTEDIAGLKADLGAQTVNFEGVFSASDVEGLWEQGSYNLSTGNKSSTLSYASRVRTTGYISKAVKHIEADDYAEFVLLVYNNGTYLGMWNGTSIVSSSVWISSADINDISGNYDYNIAVRNKADASAEITPTYAQHLTFSTNTGKTVSVLSESVVGSFSGERMVSSSEILADLDDAIVNRYYSINTTGLTNQPSSKKGHLLYFGLEGGGDVVKSGREVQLYLDDDNRFFYRANTFHTGAPWSEWKEVMPQGIPKNFMNLSVFPTIGIIGDSFASGEIYESASSSEHVDYYALSWGQILGRMTGTVVTNYSEGGLTSKSWLTDADHGLATMLADTPKALYIVALGINDTNKLTLGTIEDIGDETADTFYRYYAEVIENIRTHAPNAVVILSTLARFTSSYNAFSVAVKAIAEYYNLGVIDISENEFFQSAFFSTNQIHSHPTALCYSGMATAYKELLEEHLNANASKYSGYVYL